MLDSEILLSPMFVLLSVGSIGAVCFGYFLSRSWGVAAFPLWQLAIILVVCVGASYFFAAREA